MKFSILIANYNNGRYFANCYNSILAQTHENWEVIIIDDGSTDDSVSIIENLIRDDDRFLFMLNDSNKGCGYTKRRTLELASGEICGFLDPDDAITANALELSIAQYKNNKIIATYSKITFCDENLEPVQDFKKIKKIYNSTYFFNCPTQLNAFFTFLKEAYSKTEGINPNLQSAVDQDLYLKILEHGNVVYIKENLYLYRRHNAGISQDLSKNKAKENFAKVIFETFKRRNIKKINGVKIPENYPGSKEVFSLLNYQNSIIYRLKLKVMILLQHLQKL
ncbi:glycosyltransferase [Chryseobacterium sp. SNU WT5]|uniref:glycosyltransferase family 2 protein n=1 Tax=Chryseobacterium sp. SNU WT5 TaxID=2594269 RepID=UPI00117D54C7|nr:glycosyltransferase [Chryseobacterium sp. SNU WT5]QDP85533.1 glycosyltransferase [Chryseobacterium sp. SNU WT5]